MRNASLKRMVAALCACALFATACARANELTIHASPLGDFMVSIGPTLERSSGLMLEIINGAFKAAGIQVRMARPAPWERAQLEALNEPGAILPILTRTPLREPNWQWVSVIYVDKMVAYTIEGHPVYHNLAELKAAHPAIAVRLGSASESLLRSENLPADAGPDMDENLMKLILGKVDVLLTQGIMIHPAVQDMLHGPHQKHLGRWVERLRATPLMDLPEWVVVSRATSAADAQRIKAALENFKRTPTYRDIIAKYEARMNHPEQP